MPETSPLVPQVLRLVPDRCFRPTTALDGTLGALAAWAETATSASLAALRGARLGDRVLLIGPRLPALAGAVRLWGRARWCPWDSGRTHPGRKAPCAKLLVSNPRS